MTTREVISYCQTLGCPTNIQKIWRWKKGYYVNFRTKKKVWYFEDHSSLPHKNKGRFRGFDYEASDVLAWVNKIHDR